MSEMNRDDWKQDGIDPGWFVRDNVGSIRSSSSYRPGGWWFLPAWQPDTAQYDVGPFRTMAAAMAAANRSASERKP